jgi:protease-4
VLLALTALGFLALVASVAGLAWVVAQRAEPTVDPGDWLHVTLKGPLVTGAQPVALVLDPADLPPTVTDIAWGIRAAATDDRVPGLFLELEDPMGGLASFQEIRSALVAFRDAGKPCVAYAEQLDFADYMLASACTEVVMPPAGIGLVTGLSAELSYYAGTLEKLGAVAQFEHVGDYKSAVEPFERSEPSPAAREAFDALFDSLFAQMTADIAASRGRTVEETRAAIDAPALAPPRIREAGLIDAVAFRDAVVATLGQAGTDGYAAALDAAPLAPSEEEPPLVPMRSWLRSLPEREGSRVVAVVYASGPIVSGEGEGGLFADQVLADKDFAGWLREVGRDEDVAAVVLRVDSPGGSGLASDQMWRAIKRLQASGRPVVVSMGDYAASGGYYISAPADRIVAQRGTLTGSIGVFGGKMALGGTWAKLGITEAAFKRGAHADLLSSSTPFTEEGRAVFRQFLQDFYDAFLDRVAEGRKRSREEIHTVAQGRVWTGEQALERGLVDTLGGLDVAVGEAASLAGIGDDYRVDTWPKPKTLFEMIAEDLSDVGEVRVDFGTLEADVAELMLVERLLADGAVALLPAGLGDGF